MLPAAAADECKLPQTKARVQRKMGKLLIKCAETKCLMIGDTFGDVLELAHNFRTHAPLRPHAGQNGAPQPFRNLEISVNITVHVKKVSL